MGFYPDHANSAFDLIQSIANAKARVGPSQERARRNLARLYLGDIDGYEEYRVVFRILSNLTHGNTTMAQEVADLERIMTRFTYSYLGSAGDVPLCDLHCCNASVSYFTKFLTGYMEARM